MRRNMKKDKNMKNVSPVASSKIKKKKKLKLLKKDKQNNENSHIQKKNMNLSLKDHKKFSVSTLKSLLKDDGLCPSSHNPTCNTKRNHEKQNKELNQSDDLTLGFKNKHKKCKRVAKYNSEKTCNNSTPNCDNIKSTVGHNTKDDFKNKLKEQLQSASFRILNEKLYTSSGSEAYDMFRSEPSSFQVYHQGFSTQVSQWPLNPIKLIISWLRKKPRNWIVADLGCGDAVLSKSVPQKVISLDLVAVAPGVIQCDMANTPLSEHSVNVVVFCLSLMGTNLTQFIVEANRILVLRGVLKIAEVESRFNSDASKFLKVMLRLGFKCISKNQKNDYFWLFDFIKIKNVNLKASLPELVLKPCLYKKR